MSKNQSGRNFSISDASGFPPVEFSITADMFLTPKCASISFVDGHHQVQSQSSRLWCKKSRASTAAPCSTSLNVANELNHFLGSAPETWTQLYVAVGRFQHVEVFLEACSCSENGACMTF